MEVERHGDGNWHFKLGPIERWIVLGIGSLFGLLCWYVVNSFATRMDVQAIATKDQGEILQKVVTQQAVTNGQLTTLSAQLADVPGLTREVAKLRVEMDATKQDVRELRQTRGLR